MRGSERTEQPTDSRRSKEERRAAREPQQTGTRYKESLEQVQRACSRSYTGHQIRKQERTGAGHQITGVADQTYLTVKDFMRADRAETDVTGCSRTSTGRMLSEPLQLDILTIEQHYRRNTEQQENKCFSGTGSGSRYRDHSRAESARKGLFISGWGYSCRKYSAFTGDGLKDRNALFCSYGTA